MIKKIIKKIYQKMDLLKDLKKPLLNFKLVLIYIIHKLLVLIKNNLNYLKIVFSNAFLRIVIDFKISFKKLFFFIIYDIGKFKS